MPVVTEIDARRMAAIGIAVIFAALLLARFVWSSPPTVPHVETIKVHPHPIMAVHE